jgi:D-glycero-alpha-D-manno-heptose-7-phosphate kinase
MIVSRAPLRISYIGGGSDYKEYSDLHVGHVIGATINQFVYVVVNDLSEIASENLRFTYRETESVMSYHELRHPVLRVLGEELDLTERLNIATFSDLPAGAGLGGSSSFTSSLIKAIFESRRKAISDKDIAEIAVRIERIRLNESGGLQDQYHASIGGFRHYQFSKNQISYSDFLMPRHSQRYIESRQLLVWSGESRESRIHAEVTKSKAIDNSESIHQIALLAKLTASRLASATTSKERYHILCEAVRKGWELKGEFTSPITTNTKRIIDTAMLFGADAVKLCGAGESGFVLILAEEELLQKIKLDLPEFQTVKPRFTPTGVSRIL